MKGMFNAHVAPMIMSQTNTVFVARTFNISMVWKDFFPLYRQMQLDYPDIYIKNAATPPVEDEDREKVHTIKVDFVLEAPTVDEAERSMDKFIADYLSRINEIGGGEMDLINPN